MVVDRWDARQDLRYGGLRLGYHGLTLVFVSRTVVYGCEKLVFLYVCLVTDLMPTPF